ncbi:unnamed protein product [Caenorhabditis angaria]|uniref:DNA2/NAM7 helicase-like C-terminal domain-containing protein n=1 Tax=Caenorhabditis angaria TaxID=860376 RepID=A0A9P1N1V3_9PELO|nr:unnamed protein product [Caenorhabditis angaria]
MGDPLINLLDAYYIGEAQDTRAPDQTIEAILDFRQCYRVLRNIGIGDRRNLRTLQCPIEFKNYHLEDLFQKPYAFYRVHTKHNVSYVSTCHPLHFETSFYSEYHMSLSQIYIDSCSEDLNSPWPNHTSFNQLLIGDIVAISNIYSCQEHCYAREYVVLKRKVENTDALVYWWNYESHGCRMNKLVASSVTIPMDRNAAEFVSGIRKPDFENEEHRICRVDIFTPFKGTQRFAADFSNDILHSVRNIRECCREIHQLSYKYRSRAQNNYHPLVTRWTAGNSHNRNNFSTIDEALKNGNQKKVFHICNIVESATAHFENMKNVLDIRSHPLELIEWKILDDEELRIGFEFEVQDGAWNSYFPKKAMIRVYGIIPEPLDIAVIEHIQNETESDGEKIKKGILKASLIILDNIDELENDVDMESIGRKLYSDVIESLENRPELIYAHLIHGKRNKSLISKLEKFQQNMPDNLFNEMMRFSKNSAAPPRHFDYENDINQKKYIKEKLRLLLNNEPTKEQTQSVYFSIHSRNPIMSIEAPVGGGKTTLLSSICCISSIFYDKCQLIVSESNGAIVSVCRKLKQFGQRNVIRITSSLAQKRNGEEFVTEFDLPSIAEKVFSDLLKEFDDDPDKWRSREELDLIARTYKMLNYMHQTSSQTNYRLNNFRKLRNIIGVSLSSAPKDPSREQIRLVFEILQPQIVIGTGSQIEQLLSYQDLMVDVHQVFIDKCSVESIFSVFSIVSMVGAGCSDKKMFPKVILVGDSKQFKPFCDNPSISKFFETSLKTIGNGIAQIKHDQMFRCQPDTSNILNQVFYENKCTVVRNSVIGEKSLFFKFVKGYASMQNSGTLDDNSIEDARFMKNRFEAEEIRKKCEELEENGIRKEDIMILAFYNGQVNLLKKKLPGYTILTVRSCQGLEAKIVLVSVARTHSWELQNRPKDEGRVRNTDAKHIPITERKEQILVALSRAKEACMVFIDPEYCAQVEIWRNIDNLCK